MIASKTEIKAFLEMTSTSKDDLIDRLIPVIESDIREYCNNGFRDEGVYIQSSDISFVRGRLNQIISHMMEMVMDLLILSSKMGRLFRFRDHIITMDSLMWRVFHQRF